ncbi:MAG TPA: lipopolysaccharide kinase InaA family protein [Amycolatopsis sp.]|uniref:protein kinase domain-containing protein n=1 Tax=Amycolatopsis sp. TaxID=37632 RepID=UPI002B464EF7|nr:lipopolysaccharide kinase InaA family protein [Amycolatopsis sp.]HKS44285.1 lipopolysaccharide kinase InaA family protein [Amycolatopsis sp.]
MKLGDVINGYRIVSEPTNNSGGNCLWAFAERGGKQFFIKCFLEPKRPRADSTASETSKRLRLEECQEFENRHYEIMKLLRPDAAGGGNLVLAKDFFCEGSTYYKATERIETSTLDKPQSLDPRKKQVLLRTLVLSLKQLHDIDVVHGDLKPGNVLVQRRSANAFYTAKLIDFDDSYLAGQPPDPSLIGGDVRFGAPEWRRYIQQDDSVQPRFLTTAVDIFALGLMTYYYLTGDLPRFPERFDSPADAVNAGVTLNLDGRLSSGMRQLVTSMTARAPGARPTIADVLDQLGNQDICALIRRTRPAAARPATRSPKTAGSKSGSKAEPAAGSKSRASRVHKNLEGKQADGATGSDRTAVKPGPGAKTSSRVRINLEA